MLFLTESSLQGLLCQSLGNAEYRGCCFGGGKWEESPWYPSVKRGSKRFLELRGGWGAVSWWPEIRSSTQDFAPIRDVIVPRPKWEFPFRDTDSRTLRIRLTRPWTAWTPAGGCSSPGLPSRMISLSISAWYILLIQASWVRIQPCLLNWRGVLPVTLAE